MGAWVYSCLFLSRVATARFLQAARRRQTDSEGILRYGDDCRNKGCQQREFRFPAAVICGKRARCAMSFQQAVPAPVASPAAPAASAAGERDEHGFPPPPQEEKKALKSDEVW